MANPIEVIKAALAAAAPVTALVGDRISPNPLAQGDAVPAIVMAVISTVPNVHLQGDGHLDEVRVQVDCYAVTATAADALAAVVRAALFTAERVLVSAITDYDPTTEFHVVTQDYLLWIDPTA